MDLILEKFFDFIEFLFVDLWDALSFFPIWVFGKILDIIWFLFGENGVWVVVIIVIFLLTYILKMYGLLDKD